MSAGERRGSDHPLRIRFRIPPPPRLHPIAVYLLAVLLPLGVLALEEAVRPWLEPIPFVLYFLVVGIVASLGGWRSGLLAATLSSACGWLFLAHSSSHTRAAGAAVGAAVFLPVATVITAFGALVREGFRERESANRELAAALRAREGFISTASHELKTPLTSLALVTQRLAQLEGASASPDATRTRLVQSSLRQVSRLVILVNNLLDLSRIDAGRMHLELRDVDLAEVVREVAERFQGELAQAGAALSVDADGPVVGRWDPLRLEQILTNLVSNAVKYGAGSPVAVHVRREGTAAVLVVADRGIGIAPEDRERIFERFERGARGRAAGGFGIGLWIVREIVRALDGRVEVESPPGEGSRFTVTLPVAGPAEGRAAPPPG
ncbi:MAG TPA: HAMP domain-containing sensor histidine kinase [Anaeromyxobacter sp.]|nr:HAMP domain-containing sensor histidine kinase [Anaeromyxobacter sp.]